jgi:hypothetical protein
MRVVDSSNLFPHIIRLLPGALVMVKLCDPFLDTLFWSTSTFSSQDCPGNKCQQDDQPTSHPDRTVATGVKNKETTGFIANINHIFFYYSPCL